MAAPTRSLLVCGGSGFLGSRICQLAAARKWTVASLSRSGEPPAWADGPPAPGGGSGRPDWADRVAWLKGDVMNPETYRGALEGVDAVVHSLGILLEADYKGVLAGRESVVAGLRRAFDSARHTADNTIRTGNPKLTYETMNRDTAVTLAEEAVSKKKGASTFLYVSAIDSFAALPARYITTKREAEELIARIGDASGMRTVSLRPSFLYDSSRALTIPLAGVLGVVSAVNGLLGHRLPFLGAAGYRPLAVDSVAAAAVKALEDDSVRGPVDVDGIRALSTRLWREGML